MEESMGQHVPVSQVAWESDTVSFPMNLAATWWTSLTRPAQFYEGVDFGGSIARPLLYYVILTVISSGFSAVWGLAGLAGGGSDMLAAELGVTPEGLLLMGFFLSPFSGLLILLVSSLVFHLFAVMLVPEHDRLASTGRVLCYAVGPSALTVLPYLGGLVGAIWTVVLLVAGMRRAHRTSMGRAVSMVLLPYALAVLVLVALLMLALVLARALPQLPA
jgi:hypothetical protein